MKENFAEELDEKDVGVDLDFGLESDLEVDDVENDDVEDALENVENDDENVEVVFVQVGHNHRAVQHVSQPLDKHSRPPQTHQLSLTTSLT